MPLGTLNTHDREGVTGGHMKLTICDNQLMVRRIAVAFFVFAAVLAVPASAEAAEWLTIDGAKHEAGVPAAAENGTWKWDGKDALELNGYNGGVISAGGKLEITCVGENSLACSEGTNGILVVHNGEGGEAADLTIKGPGPLSVKTGGKVGSIQSEGNVTLSGVNMKIDASEYEAGFGILSVGKTRVENKSDVEIASSMNGIAGNTGIEIDDSKVVVKNNNTTSEHIKTSYGLQAGLGPVAISNGASVDIRVAAANVIGISSVFANGETDGPAVSISDSTVNISAASSIEHSLSFGIVAAGSSYPNLISIVRSTVVSECSGGPALISYNQALAEDGLNLAGDGLVLAGDTPAQAGDGTSVAGAIDLEGCEVVTPEGGYICNLNSKITAYADDESEEMGSMAGQFIGTSNTEDGITMRATDDGYASEWPNPISNKVVIKPITAPDSPMTPPVVDNTDNQTTPGVPGGTKPSDTTEKPGTPEQPTKKPAQDKTSGSKKTKKSAKPVTGNLPATGDAFVILPVSFAAAAGCVALLTGLTSRRRSE